jgi:hypothetical protein
MHQSCKKRNIAKGLVRSIFGVFVVCFLTALGTKESFRGPPCLWVTVWVAGLSSQRPRKYVIKDTEELESLTVREHPYAAAL